jgi:hypothetical protein
VISNNPSTQPDSAAVEAAKQNASGWVYKIDFQYPSQDQVPHEAIVGAWKVNAQGVIEGEFVPNASYCPIERSRRRLIDAMYEPMPSLAGLWVVEIDPRYEQGHELRNEQVDVQAIVGYWLIDESGHITDQFRPNTKYRPSDIDAIMQARL